MVSLPAIRPAALVVLLAVLLLPLVSGAQAADALDDLVAGLAAGKPPTPILVADGFQFTEGPVADADGNILFSDIPAGKIHRWIVPQDRPATDGPFEVETWLDPSGNTNGLCFDRNGLLLACQMGQGRRVVAIDPQSKAITPLAERFEGKRLNAPNDLWVDADNCVWFTDPAYERTPADTELDAEAVYFISPDRTTVTRVADGFARPNGIVGSPDGTTLYVTDRKGGMTWAFRGSSENDGSSTTTAATASRSTIMATSTARRRLPSCGSGLPMARLSARSPSLIPLRTLPSGAPIGRPCS